MNEPTQTIPTVPDDTPGAGPERFRWVPKAIAIVVVIIILLIALLALSGGSDDMSGAESRPDPATVLADVEDPDDERSDDETSGDTGSDDADQNSDADGDVDDSEDALDADDDSEGFPEGFPEGGANVEEDPVPSEEGDGPVELEPVETVDEQCGKVLATGGTLLVTPDPAELEPGDMSDSLTIRNCGDEETDWTAKTVPNVTLDTIASTLAAGETTQLGFTIDSDAYEPGAIEFKIKVSEPGHNEYVDVHAFRKAVGKDYAAGNNTISGGEGVGGCNNECITKAWLTPTANTANVSFEVKTDTPAKIRVWVDTQPPNPFKTPMAVSPNGSTHWNTVLKPLQYGTEYHLLLRATDGNGKTDQRTTTFTTKTPAPHQNQLAGVDPKCHAQCISTALLTPTGDHSVQHLEVEATTPALFQAWLSTQEPTYSDGVPSFDDPDVVKVSGLEYHDTWSVDLEPLEGSTTYHIIVRAEDTEGEVAHQVGSFTTKPEPTYDVLVTFHRLTVTHDGDSSWKNRGELSFAWSVGKTTVGSRGEEKMSDGDGFSFNRSKASYLITGLHADDFLPNVRVAGSERDADGIVEFCAMGRGAPYDAGRNDDCDAKWNVASAGLVTVGSIDGMARCSEFGVAFPTSADGCMLIQTADHGDDYARFNVLVSFHVAD